MGLTFNLGRVSPSVFTDSSLNVGIGAAPSGTYKLEVTGTAKVSGITSLTSATASTSTTTGGLVVTGGVGIGGALFGTSVSATSLNIVKIDNLTTAIASFAANNLSQQVDIWYGGIRMAGSSANIDLNLIPKGTGVLSVTGIATFSAKISVKGGSNAGGYYMDYQTDATSRSFRISSEHLAFGDFVIQKSTTRTGTTYENLLYFDANRTATFSSSLQITGYSAPTSGEGLELFYLSGVARLFGYDRTNSVYKPMEIGVNNQLYLPINGNVLIGSTSDQGSWKAQVTGNLFVRGNNSTSANSAIYTDNSSGTTLLNIRNDGLFYTGTAALSPYNYGVSGGVALYVGSSGQLGYNSSTRESKSNIINIENVDWLKELQPVTFNKKKKDDEGNYTEELESQLEYGLIAEDVEMINSNFVFYDKDNKLAGVHYDRLITPMLKAIQEQQAIITSLQDRLDKARL